MRITEDLLLGAKYSLTHSGATLVRLFDVSGLTPGQQTLAQAAAAVDSVTNTRIPRYGDPHPAVPGLFAIEIDATPLDGSRTAARVSVKYGTPTQAPLAGAVQVRIGSANGHKLLTQLPDGSFPTVSYTDGNGNTLQQRFQIPVLTAGATLEIVRMEPQSPLKLAQKFGRTVNSSPWQNGAAHAWLCKSINGVSKGTPLQFEVSYLFEYDADGWERLEYFVDRYTGKIPDDVAVSQNNDKGIARILAYRSADFSQLKLPAVY